MSHTMMHGENPDDPKAGPGSMIQQLEAAINEGSEAVEAYCWEDVLVRSFESDLVNYYGDTGVCYPIPSVRPSRFGQFGVTVEPVGDGYHIEVTAQYMDAAPPPDEATDEIVDRLSGDDLVEVTVSYQADASIGHRGCFLDASVIISRAERADT